MTKRKDGTVLSEADSEAMFGKRWKDAPQSLAEHDEHWAKRERLEQQKADRASRRVR